MNDLTIFARRLVARREALGMTQQDVADASGLTQSAISYFEKGLREPSLLNAVRLAKALAVTVDALACDTSIEERVAALEKQVASLDHRTVGSLMLGRGGA